MPIDFPKLSVYAGTLKRDSIIEDILAITLGDAADIDEDVLNFVGSVGDAISVVCSSLFSSWTRMSMGDVGLDKDVHVHQSIPATKLDCQIVALDGGIDIAKAKRFDRHII